MALDILQMLGHLAPIADCDKWLDINLPDHSGWDVMRELRRLGIDVPTIVVSAVRVNQRRLDEFHPMAHLPKPLLLEALLRLVFNESTAG